MAKAKKKQATRTAKKTVRSTKVSSARRGRGSRAASRTYCSKSERNHIYLITVMGMVTAILLCASAAMMMV